MKLVLLRHRQLTHVLLPVSNSAKHRFFLKHSAAHVIQSFLLARFLRLEIVPIPLPNRDLAHDCFLLQIIFLSF